MDTAADLLASLDRGESLPASWYVDPAIAEREVAGVFRRSWNYVGPAGELASPPISPAT